MKRAYPVSYTHLDVYKRQVPVGYADGYNRALSGVGKVLIHGEYAPITGRICMDQFMVDVTDIKGVKKGDRVILAGEELSLIHI